MSEGDHVKIEISSDDFQELLSIQRFNTLWTSLGAIAGWIALVVIVIAIID